MKDLSRSLLTSQKKLRLHPSIKFPDADVDDDEDYDKGFEDEDWLIAMFNKLSLVSDQIYINLLVSSI